MKILKSIVMYPLGVVVYPVGLVMYFILAPCFEDSDIRGFHQFWKTFWFDIQN